MDASSSNPKTVVHSTMSTGGSDRYDVCCDLFGGRRLSFVVCCLSLSLLLRIFLSFFVDHRLFVCSFVRLFVRLFRQPFYLFHSFAVIRSKVQSSCVGSFDPKSVGWLAGWLIGWLVGWLVALVGCNRSFQSSFPGSFVRSFQSSYAGSFVCFFVGGLVCGFVPKFAGWLVDLFHSFVVDGRLACWLTRLFVRSSVVRV